MDLHYKGINSLGRAEWCERELAAPYRPEGLVMEKWQVEQYKPFVEGILSCIGRNLSKDELSVVAWLSGIDPSTINSVMSLIKAANQHGKSS